jgi:PTH2 family peptidyl-tRNA hydrolase
MDNNVSMYIVMNDSLKMGKGKIAAQCGHAIVNLTRRIEQEPSKRYNDIFNRWHETGETIIVLKASEEKLIELKQFPNSTFVIDEGRTQIEPGSLTAVGFLPARKCDMIGLVSECKLL